MEWFFVGRFESMGFSYDEYTKEEEEKIWEEVLQWAVSCPL